MLFNILVVIIISSISLVILIQTKNLSEKFNFFDNPASETKKIHKYPISNIGGLSCLIPFLLSLIISFYTENYFSKKYIIITFISSFFYFFLGRYDDLKNISPNIKFICFVFIFLFLYPLEPNLIVYDLKFRYLDSFIPLNNYSIYFTLFCLFIFYNSSNFIDGVNGLYASTIIFWIVSLIFLTKIFSLIFMVVILSLLIFLYFNLKNKVFFGNSGNTFLTCFVGSAYIFSYNKFNNIYCDEIFFLFLIPGLDTIRLILERLLKGKSPLEGDNRHLHHIILKISNDKLVWIFNLFIILIPILLLKILNNFYSAIIISLITYLLLVYLLPKKSKLY